MVMPPLPGMFNKINAILGRYDDTDIDVENIVKLLDLKPTDFVLDVPCGFGRVAKRLHELGYKVEGIDLSAEQVALAEMHCPGPSYSVADMRNVNPDKYDVILNIYSSFGYLDTLEEDVDCLRCWYRGLKAGGRLVMELCDVERSKEIDRQEQHLLNEFGQYVRVTGPATEIISVDYGSNILSVDYCMDGEVVSTKTRLYEQSHIVALLKSTGFSSVDCFGDFSGISKSNSTGLVILARK